MKLNLRISNKISATLVKPNDFKNPLPGLIFVHGWKSNKEGNTKRAEEISKLGFTSKKQTPFICLCLDLRGHGQSQGTIEQFSRRDHLEDIKESYNYLQTLPEVDKEKISIIGSSYGGYLSAVAANYLKFDKLVLRVPALYFDEKFDVPTETLIGTDETGRAFKTWGLTPENSLALKGVINFPGEILIIEAERDTVIPHQVIENYLKVIKNKSRLTYEIMKGAPHSLETEEQELGYIDILKKWLPETLPF